MRTISIPNLDFFLQSNEFPNYLYRKTFDEARHLPFVILHTSGSTGLPQLVKVSHGTVASMDANQLIPLLSGTPVLGSSFKGSRMLMTFPLFHMASFTLLLGLAVYYGVIPVLPPANEPLTAHLIDSIHTHACVDGSALPPSIVVDLYHEKKFLSRLGRLKYLLFAGGSLPQEVGDAVCRVTHLATVIGSTETAFPPHEVCDSEDWGYVRYSPFHGSVFRPLNEDGLSEQIIVRRLELDLFQSVFSTYPDIDEFRTKDLYREHPTKPGLWKFCGRTDDVIVFSNAEKFNPVDFEGAVSSHPAIRTALVGGHGKFQTCLLIEPTAIHETEAEKATLLNEIWPTIEGANRVCPSHARVMKDLVVFTDKTRGVERAGKGTVQRMMTLGLYREEIETLYQAPALPNTAPDMLIGNATQEADTLRSALFRIVSACTWLNGELTATADLFELGLDSLQTISLSKQINAYLLQTMLNMKLVIPQIIYAHPNIEMLESTLQDAADSAINSTASPRMQAIFDKWSLNLPKAKQPHSLEARKPSVVLLTGSTGSLGSYILDLLIRMPNVQKIYCLNRKHDGEIQQTKSSKSKGLQTRFQKVTFLQCDLSQPSLGLQEDTYNGLLQEVTHVIHNAWDVNFNRPLEAFINPHISGIRHLIDFCNQSTTNTRLLFVSTQSTALGQHSRQAQPIPEAVLYDWESSLPMGYAQSKLIAEQLIDAAARVSGLQSTICRVGQIAGPTTEQGCWSLKEWFPSLVASSVTLGMLPEGLGEMDMVDWIPVDLVAKIVLELLFVDSEDMSLGLNGHQPANPGDSPSELQYNAVDGPPDGKQRPVLHYTRESLSTNYSNPEVPNGDTTTNCSAHRTATFTPPSNPQTSTEAPHTNPLPTHPSTNPPIEVYNILNPHPTTYPALLPTIRSSLPHALPLVPFATWLDTLRIRAEDESQVANLPAIRLLSFFEGVVQGEGGAAVSEGWGNALSTEEAVRYSKTMRGLEAVGKEWIWRWVRQWGFGGKG
jgi:nucleoside-diphosphate-sugar epimerase